MNGDGGGGAGLNFFDGLGISISELISSSEEISVETDADRLLDFFVVVAVCVSRI